MSDLTELQQRLRTQRPAAWDRLPDFALYMDQVLSCMDRQILRFDGEDALTAAMVNNYTKSGLVPRAEGKKYNRTHLAYLAVICVLKRVLSTRDMDLLIREELRDGRAVEEGYETFRESLDRALNLVAGEVERRPGGDGDLADGAIHFALMSYAAGLASSRYVSLLREREGDAGGRRNKKEKERE